jgi:polysaccharide biosynthesis protein VpsQ
MNMHRITACYAITLVGLIVAANIGWADPLRDAVEEIPGGDKLCHLILIGGLAFLMNASLAGRRMRFGWLSLLLGTAILLPLMTLEEFSHLWLENRSFSLGDLLCNYVAIVVAGWLASGWLVKSDGRHSSRIAKRVSATAD